MEVRQSGLFNGMLFLTTDGTEGTDKMWGLAKSRGMFIGGARCGL